MHKFTIKSVQLNTISEKERVEEVVVDAKDKTKKTKIVRDVIKTFPGYATTFTPNEKNGMSSFVVRQKQADVKKADMYTVGEQYEVSIKKI